MDISMPQMDGIEATEQILECCRVTRVLCFPRLISRAYKMCLEVGAKGYVLKDDAAKTC